MASHTVLIVCRDTGHIAANVSSVDHPAGPQIVVDTALDRLSSVRKR